MGFRKSTALELELFRGWSKVGRIEEETCRPVQDGKRIKNSSQLEVLTFTKEKYDEPLGRFIYFNHNPRNLSCEFGYIINPKYRARGFGTEMVQGGINYLFADKDLGLNKLYRQTGEFNISSIKILEKLGLHRDGILREHHELDGKMWSDFIYSILKEEWIRKKQG